MAAAPCDSRATPEPLSARGEAPLQMRSIRAEEDPTPKTSDPGYRMGDPSRRPATEPTQRPTTLNQGGGDPAAGDRGNAGPTRLPSTKEIQPTDLPMKPLRQRLLGAAALLSALIAASPGPAHAAPPPAPAQGDVFLGSGPPPNRDPANPCWSTSPHWPLWRSGPGRNPLPIRGNPGVALASKYGVNWHTRADLRWALFASNNATNPTVAASRAQVPFGTPAAVFPALGLQARGSVATQIGTVTFNYSQQEAIAGVPKGVFQVNEAVSASYSYQVSGGTTAFGTLSQWTSIEASFAGGAANQALDFFRFTGGRPTGTKSAGWGPSPLIPTGN